MYSTRYSFEILTQLEFSRHIIEKGININFHQSPSRGSRVVSREGTDMKLIGAFRNVANAPKKRKYFFISASRLPKQHCLWNVPRLGPFLLLVMAMCRWRLAQSTDGMTMSGKTRSTQRKTCPSPATSTVSLTWTSLEPNSGIRGDRPATNHFSHGAKFDCNFT